MSGLVIVLRCVFVLGLIAATDPAAAQAGPEVDPGVSHRNAAIANVPGGLDAVHQFQVGAVGFGTFAGHVGTFFSER
jgi:hypothetical protein